MPKSTLLKCGTRRSGRPGEECFRKLQDIITTNECGSSTDDFFLLWLQSFVIASLVAEHLTWLALNLKFHMRSEAELVVMMSLILVMMSLMDVWKLTDGSGTTCVAPLHRSLETLDTCAARVDLSFSEIAMQKIRLPTSGIHRSARSGKWLTYRQLWAVLDHLEHRIVRMAPR